MTAAIVVGAAALAGLVALRRRRARATAQDPQNIYPLW
jgi:hypothetical protein